MIATFANSAVCAALGLAFWSLIGFPIARQIISRPIAILLAPLIGWAIHSVLALPIFMLIGMSAFSVLAVAAISALVALFLIFKPTADSDCGEVPCVSVWPVVGAALVALAVMAALLPKGPPDAMGFAGPIFDHVKVAIVDEIARLGVPPGNPFVGQAGGSTKLSYYYLWHFAAAELAIVTGLGGWNADAGMTAFTAFSTLLLMMAFAVHISSKSSSAAWVLLVALAVSIRPFLIDLIGLGATDKLTGYPTGFAAWLFQVTWAPQHVASAGCAVIAVYLIKKLIVRRDVVSAVVLALVSAASFQSSTWIGGITYPLAAICIALFLAVRAEPVHRTRFVILLIFAGAISVVLDAPFIVEQMRMSFARNDGFPIAIGVRDILGEESAVPSFFVLNFIAYWTTNLLTEFAAFYPAGIIMLAKFARDKFLPTSRKDDAKIFGLLAIVSLAVGCLLVSQIGANNDLSWRGVLPAVLILIVGTSAGLSCYLRTLHWSIVAFLLILIAAASYQGGRGMIGNIYNSQKPATSKFAASAEMWADVRAHSAIGDRVANNPMFLADVTEWPVNISWALLADRRSCYAGEDLALPFASIGREKRAQIDLQFMSVFGGSSTPNDISDLATKYDCKLVIITPDDGAWNSDPFATSNLYRLASSSAQWKIYKKNEFVNSTN